MRLQGRTWCFNDDINTEVIMPMDVIPIARSERPQHMFRANRPGWAAQVKPGDIMIAGRNFGMGSSRAAAEVMKDLGLACLVAESLNGLFFRICVNYAFPALVVPGVRAGFTEGDEALVDFESATVTNLSTGSQFVGEPWPDFALRMLKIGGLLKQLETEGKLYAADWYPGTDERAESARC